MVTTIQLQVPVIFAETYHNPQEMEQSFYEDIILGEYQKGCLSLREAADMLGLTYEGFLEWLGARQLSFICATPAELAQDYQAFERLMARHRRTRCSEHRVRITRGHVDS